MEVMKIQPISLFSFVQWHQMTKKRVKLGPI